MVNKGDIAPDFSEERYESIPSEDHRKFANEEIDFIDSDDENNPIKKPDPKYGGYD